MSSGLEVPPTVAAIENNLFYDENKLLKSQINDDVFQTNEKLQETAISDVDGRVGGGENLDFTADILDLLLCVQNDENARQNIESIMDQWDEMNLLHDDAGNAKSSENNLQTKVSVGTRTQEQGTSPKTSENLLESKSTSIMFQNPVVVVADSASISNQTESCDPSATDKRESMPSGVDPANGRSIAQPEIIQFHSRVKTAAEPVKPEFSNKSLSTKPESGVCSAVTSTSQQAENAALCVKIHALSCSSCGQTYSQLMSSGTIPKIPSKPYPCPFCRGNYYQKSSAELHMKVHMEDDTLKCRFCSEASANFKRNGLGQNVDENVNPAKHVKHDAFPCLICSASLSSRVDLEKHIRSHKRSSKNYRKSLRKDSSERKNEQQQKYVCNDCKKLFRSKTDLDFHSLSHDSKFTKIVDKIVLNKTQSNILDHCYGKTNTSVECSTNVSSLSTGTGNKMDENQNLKTAVVISGTANSVSAMEIDDLVVNYDPPKLNGDTTSFDSPTCDTNSSYGQPNYSSSICDVSSTSSNAKPVSISASSIGDAHLYGQNNQIFVSTSAGLQRNCSNEGSFLTDDSINFDQNLFKTFTNVDTAFSSGYDVLQRYLDEQPRDNTSNALSNSTTQANSDGNNSIFADVKPVVDTSPVSNSVEMTKVVNINPLIMSSTAGTGSGIQNLIPTSSAFGVKIPVSNLKLGTNVLLGNANNSVIEQTNKNYVIMYVLPAQSANSQTASNPSGPHQFITNKVTNPDTFIRLPPADNKMTYLVPVTNGVNRQSEIVAAPNTCNQKVNIRHTNENIAGHQKFRLTATGSKLHERKSVSALETIRLDPGKLHTAQLPPAKQIPNKRNILQLAYDDACKLIEDSIAQKPTSDIDGVGVASGSTLNGNYKLLKQMLNSKPRLSRNFVSENSQEQITPPVDISFTHGQVTFQYKNRDPEDGNELGALAQPATPAHHVCEVCQATFANENYIPHLRTHSKTLYKCTYCQKIFVLQDNLIHHMNTHLQPPVFNCKMCSKTFSNVLLFKLHILVHKGLLFICVSCVKLFNKKEDYETHLQTHNKNDLACVECKRKFPNSNGESNSHFVCPDCAVVNESHVNGDSAILSNGESFRHNNFSESVAERTTEFEDLCYPCPYCDVLASGGVEFKNHFSYHLTRPIKCFVCCEKFDRFVLLANHMKTHTLPRKFFCQYCAKKFPDRESYQNHYHPNFKPYSCMVCEQGLFNQTDLTVHAMNHDMTAKSCCNFCSEQFQSSDLDDVFSHKSSHLKDSIAECDTCDAKFILYSELLNHVSKLHDEEGKRKIAFKCTKCNIFLSSDEQLNEHEQKHLKMDFVCQQCRASFTEFNELLRHWNKLHSKSTLKCFKCSCCSRFFLNEPQWLEHAEQSENKGPVLLPYSLQQFGDHSFKLEPDTKKTYCCNQCNESFRSKVDIIKHMRRLQHK